MAFGARIKSKQLDASRSSDHHLNLKNTHKMYTEQQLIRAYKKGLSNGIGLSNPRDRRYNQDADKLEQDALNAMIPGGLTDEPYLNW